MRILLLATFGMRCCTMLNKPRVLLDISTKTLRENIIVGNFWGDMLHNVKQA